MARVAASLLLLLLLLGSLSLPAEGKRKKKSKKEWKEAWKKIEEEEFEDWEEEKAEREAEHAKYSDPMKMVEEMGATDAAAMMGGMGSSSSGGPAMTFVHMKSELTREDTEEVVVKWRDLLYTNGFDIKPYVVEDNLVLLNMDEQYKVKDLRDFVLDPYFAEDKVESFEYNSKKWYPEGSEEDIKEKEKLVSTAHLEPFAPRRRPHLAACCCATLSDAHARAALPLPGDAKAQARGGRAREEVQPEAWGAGAIQRDR